MYKPRTPDDAVSGESLERARVSSLLVLPAMSSRATRCRDQGTFAISIYAQTEDFTEDSNGSSAPFEASWPAPSARTRSRWTTTRSSVAKAKTMTSNDR